MRRRAVLLSVPLLAAACAQPIADPPVEPAKAPGTFERRAAEVAAAWRTAPGRDVWRTAFVPLQDLTVPLADARLTDATKYALSVGAVRLGMPLPREATGRRGTVRFEDGTTLAVPLVGVAQAFAALRSNGQAPCPGPAGSGPATPPPAAPGAAAPDSVASSPAGCTELVVTGATTGTVRLYTSRGPATVPAWVFDVRGVGRVARVAVAPSAIRARPAVAQPTTPYPTGLVGAEDFRAAEGTELTVRFRLGACDTNLEPLVVESADVVVIGGSVTRTGDVCTEQLLFKPATVKLRAPLGTRTALDAQTGAPLTLTVG